MRFIKHVAVSPIIAALLICETHPQPEQGTVRWYAAEAKKHGSHEALIGNFGGDSEEGENLLVRCVTDALNYDWVIGEPIEETTLTWPSWHGSQEPDSIFTGYRLRVNKRSRPAHNVHPTASIEEEALRKLPPTEDEVLIIKSDGDITIDGVLVKSVARPVSLNCCRGPICLESP